MEVKPVPIASLKLLSFALKPLSFSQRWTGPNSQQAIFWDQLFWTAPAPHPSGASAKHQFSSC